MTDYSELVKALRSKFFAYDVTGNHNSAQLYKDAADAIEALQAEIRESMQRCAECGDELAQQMPKQGEWLYDSERTNEDGTYNWNKWKCSICGKHAIENIQTKYCPNCGAKMMEAQ